MSVQKTLEQIQNNKEQISKLERQVSVKFQEIKEIQEKAKQNVHAKQYDIEVLKSKIKERKEKNIRLKDRLEQERKQEGKWIFSQREDNICPNCNVELVQKSGKYGIFLGCPNYPKCKYVKPSKEFIKHRKEKLKAEKEAVNE